MTPNPRKTLSIKIKTLRKTKDLTQEKLAEICNVSWRTISNIERGAVVPGLELICNLSKHLNVSIDELLDNKFQTNKSLTRLKKESEIIEEIVLINDKLLDHLHKYVKLIKNSSDIF